MSLFAVKPQRASYSYSPESPVTRRPATQEHDLPVLAIEENPPVKLDWEYLLAQGVQPALILGAERRWHRSR
jgi:hypothetical protein